MLPNVALEPIISFSFPSQVQSAQLNLPFPPPPCLLSHVFHKSPVCFCVHVFFWPHRSLPFALPAYQQEGAFSFLFDLFFLCTSLTPPILLFHSNPCPDAGIPQLLQRDNIGVAIASWGCEFCRVGMVMEMTAVPSILDIYSRSLAGLLSFRSKPQPSPAYRYLCLSITKKMTLKSK